MAGVIDTYLAQLGRRLAFDSALSARVCAEVEDHLREAAEANATLARDDAECRAVQHFGSVDDLAARFATDTLGALAMRGWLALAAAALATFLAMRLRHMLLDSSAFEAAPAGALFDRFGFIVALTAGLAGWLTVHATRAPTLSSFRIAGLAGAVSAIALIASIVGGALVATTAGRQFEFPTLAALLLESAMALWLAAHMWSLAHRAKAANRALKG